MEVDEERRKRLVLDLVGTLLMGVLTACMVAITLAVVLVLLMP